VKLNRRSFIKLIPAVAVAVAGGSWWFLGRTATTEPNAASQSAENDRYVHVQQSVTTDTNNDQTRTSQAVVFPVTWNGDLPTEVDLSDYRLKVDGDVSRPLELTVDDLYSMSYFQKTLRIQCVEGWAADVLWEGMPLSYLLNQAGASLENIAHVTVEGVTGYGTTLSSDEVANSGNIIALKAGGAPLTVEHGYPARLVAPERLGLDWVKYVSRITCTNK
jgi:DMSO/TMAO reductase YedYZ molybdopterin-dependent catalytic subunit